MIDKERCDQNIFETGEHVGVYTFPKNLLNLVSEMMHNEGNPTDWYYIGGHANVLTLGDVKRVKDVFDRYQMAYRAGQKSYSDLGF